MLNFNLISKEDPEKLLYFYNKAYSWDKERLCFFGKPEIISEIVKYDNYVMQEGNNYIGFASNGSIENNIRTYITVRDQFIPKRKKLNRLAELCTIIHPNYRGLGYGSKLLESLLEVTKLKYSSAVAYILIYNKASLALYKNVDFQYRCSVNNGNFYEKKLELEI